MVKKLTGLLTRNTGLKLLALLFSMILWMVVVNIDDPKITRPFTTNVIADNEDYLTDQGKYYEIVGESNSVTFNVTGKRSYIEKLSGSDFKAVANFQNVENFQRVPVDITPQKYSSYINVSTRTRYLEITVEDIMSEPFVINVQTVGKVAEGRALGTPEATPSILRVSGPQSVVSLIAKVVAPVDVSNMSSDITDSVLPVLYDEDGNVMDTSDLSMSIQTVLVSVPILNTKDVGLNFSTTGAVPEGYEFLGIEYEPESVTIKGAATVLNTISSITIPPDVLDLTGATGDITTTVDVSSYLPADVAVVDSEASKIEVTAKVEKSETRIYKIPAKNITVNNLPERYKAEFATEEIDVQITGLTSDLDVLEAGDIYGSISVSGLVIGSHDVTLNLILDEKYVMTPIEVAVGIVEKEDTDSGKENSDVDKKETEENNENSIENTEN